MSELTRVPSHFPINGKCSIAFVGEAPGAEEALKGEPFVGASGWLLGKVFRQLGLKREDVYIGNVFSCRPPGNEISYFFMKKGEARKKSVGLADRCPYPPFGDEGYLLDEWWPELKRMQGELASVEPVVIVGLGATALWALTGHSEITAYRGVAMPSSVGSIKCICTFHPASVLRSWDSMRVFLSSDISKAKREAAFPEIRLPSRQVMLAETLGDLAELRSLLLDPPSGALAIDIETEPDFHQITCIGFAPSSEFAVTVPLWDLRQFDNSWWPTLDEETEAWRWVKEICESPVPKVMHKGSYDAQYLHRYGIDVKGYIHDTMNLHHALQPELRKGLGMLASLYLNEGAWKPLGGKKKKDEMKDEE